MQLPVLARNNEIPLNHDTCATQMFPLGLSTFSSLTNMGTAGTILDVKRHHEARVVGEQNWSVGRNAEMQSRGSGAVGSSHPRA